MTGKRNRAIWFAVIFLMESCFMIGVMNKGLSVDIDLKKVYLPIAIVQVVGWLMTGIALLVQYVVLRKAQDGSKAEKNSGFGIGLFLGVLWIGSSIQLSLNNLFGVKEAIFLAVQVLFLSFYVFKMQFRYHVAEIGNDEHAKNRTKKIILGRKVMATIILVEVFAVSSAQAFLYRNDVFSPKRVIVMTVANCAMVFAAVWFNTLWNLIAAVSVLVLQAGVSIYEFAQLNRSQKMLSAFNKLAGDNISEKQILLGVMGIFLILLIITAALQFTGELKVLGKMAAVSVSVLIICVVGTITLVESKAEGTLEVNKDETTNQVAYDIYVGHNSPLKEVAELSGKKVGYTEEEHTLELAEVLGLFEKDCASAEKMSYENTSQLLAAYLAGEVEGILCSKNTIDNMTLELEVLDEERVFEEEVRSLKTYYVATHKEEESSTETEEWTETEEVSETEEGTETEEWTETEEGPVQNGDGPEMPKPSHYPNAVVRDITKDPFIIYFSGIDTYGPITTKSRSDVNVIVAVNPKTKEIALLSTPRDAYVYVAGHHPGQRDKLTHAGNWGVQCSEKTLENLYGIKINYYIRINFSSVEKIVDLLGGLDVWSYETFTSRWGYKYTSGWNHVMGKQALVFARERKTVKGGDTVRGKHHIELLKAVIRKITTTAILTRYQSLLSTASSNFQTDLSAGDIAALVAMQLGDGAEWHFSSYAACGKGTNDWCASYKGGKLYVNNLHPWSVKKGNEMVNRVLKGEHIKDGEYSYDK